MKKSLPFGLLCVVLWHCPEITFAFHPSAAPTARRGKAASPSISIIPSSPLFRRGQQHAVTIAGLWPLTVNSAPKIVLENPTKTELEELREYELDEEDFLLAKVKPKVLNHERDFFRQATRIQAWDEYVLVSILCTSISYNALNGYQLNPAHEGIFLYDVVLETIIQCVAGFACLSGIYATMVFSLSILYGKTALGNERDPQYDSFLDNTLEVRITAFRAFSMSLGLFAVLVVLVLAEHLPTAMLPPVGTATVGCLYVGYRDWKKLVDEATPIYYDD